MYLVLAFAGINLIKEIIQIIQQVNLHSANLSLLTNTNIWHYDSPFYSSLVMSDIPCDAL